MEAIRTQGPATALQASWQRTYAGEMTVNLYAPLGPTRPAERGGADALAAWGRWHPPALDAHFSQAEWPWYAVLERARVETLASRDLPGMALNLSDLAGLEPADRRLTGLHRLARRILAAPTAAEAEPASGARPVASPSGGLLPLVSRWWRRARPVTEAATGPANAHIAQVLDQARPSLADPAAFAERVHRLVRELALAAAADPANKSVATASRPQPPLPSPPRDEVPYDAAPTPDEGAETALTHAGDGATSPTDRRYPGYAIYATKWDQTLEAKQVYRPADAANLQGITETDQRQARRLALRLQRRLLAVRLRRWCFDQDEGRLDSRRLSRLLTHRTPYAVFRQEEETPVPEACVTLLVDQSGSMRGLPQHLTAQAIDLAVQTLEICRVHCEVLGYTTRYGADSPPARAWRAAGRPAAPGRLNALRHLIYKRVDQPWRRCREHLGLLLREDLGRENIDGEALDWAARRLSCRPEPCKILIVLCDGAPYDEATVSANGRRFLEDHLHAVIAALDASPIQLAAIGAAHTVVRYYRQALIVDRADHVAAILFEHLGDLLTSPNR